METENNVKFKYIVYQTTNVVNNKIYIGVHRTVNPNIFDGYLGCGVKINDTSTYEHAKTAFQYAVKKYGPKNFKRQTLAIFDTEIEAYKLEELLVTEEFLSRDDVYNMVLGGFSGMYNSKKIKVHQYTSDGKYLATFDSMVEAGASFGKRYTAISSAVAYKVKAFGYFWSTEKVPWLDLTLYNLGLDQRKEVYLYDKDGNFITVFTSQTAAAKHLKTNTGCIGRSCLLGFKVNDYYCCWIKGTNYSEARNSYIKTRPVYKYDVNGRFIRAYETQEQAEKDNRNINITKAIRLKEPDENQNLWSLERVEIFNQPKNSTKKRKVGMYSKDSLIKTFDSATAAAKEMGTAVWHALSGRNSTHKGYIFKYLS